MSLLENIETFVRASDLGSLSQAARQLGLSPAVASNRLKQLELRLGARLMVRTTRTLRLTEAGRAFYDNSQTILRAVENAEFSMRGLTGMPHGNVLLSAPLGLGRHMIAPLVAEFCEKNPTISVRMRLSDHPVDMVRDGIDLGIKLGPPEGANLISRSVTSCTRVVVTSDAYLRRAGEPKLPTDLLHHECLVLRSGDPADRKWLLRANGHEHPIMARGRIDADDSDVLIQWALAGRGIVSRPLFEVGRFLAAGRLKEILLDYRPLPDPVALFYPDRAQLPAKTRLLFDFLAKHLKLSLLETSRLETV